MLLNISLSFFVISIHALRKESDLTFGLLWIRVADFNPRSP